MGTSKITLRGLSTFKLIPSDVDTFKTAYNNIRLNYGLDPVDINIQLNKESLKYFNSSFYRHFGSTNEFYIYERNYDENKIEAFIEINTGRNVEEIIEIATTSDRPSETSNILHSLYEKSSWNVDSKLLVLSKKKYSSVPCYVSYTHNDETYIARYIVKVPWIYVVETGEYFKPTYEYTSVQTANILTPYGSKEIRFVNPQLKTKYDDDGNFYVVYTLNSIDYEIELEIPESHYQDKVAIFKDKNIKDKYFTCYINESQLEVYEREYRGLHVNVKIDNKQKIDNNDFLLRTLGITDFGDTEDEDSLASIVDNDKYENLIFSFMVSPSSNSFKNTINRIYGVDGSWNKVSIYSRWKEGTDTHSLQLTYREFDGDYGFGMDYFIFNEDGDEILHNSYGILKYQDAIDNNLPFFIMPIDVLKKSSARKRYQYYEEMFSGIVSVVEERKLKWYQSIMYFINDLTGGLFFEVLNFVGSLLNLDFLRGILPKWIVDILSVALQIALFAGTGPTAGLTSILSNPKFYMEALMVTLNNLADKSLGKLSEKIEDVRDETKKILEQMDKKQFATYYDPWNEQFAIFNELSNPLDVTFNIGSINKARATQADIFYLKY